MIAGKQDGTGKFLGLSVMLCNHEDSESYKFMFDWIKKVAAHPPKAIMADAAFSITKGMKDVFLDCNRLHCFFHLQKNVKVKLSKVRSLDPSLYLDIITHIQCLQQFSLDEEMFVSISALFLR